MGEYVWTTLTVGGRIKRSDVKELVGVLAEFEPEKVEGVTPNMMPTGGVIVLQGTRNYGSIEDLAPRLQKLGLTYVCHHCASPGCFDAGIERWAPGDVGSDCGASNDARPTVSLDRLMLIKEDGCSLDDVIARLAAFDDKQVPPLEIVEDDGSVKAEKTRIIKVTDHEFHVLLHSLGEDRFNTEAVVLGNRLQEDA